MRNKVLLVIWLVVCVITTTFMLGLAIQSDTPFKVWFYSFFTVIWVINLINAIDMIKEDN